MSFVGGFVAGSAVTVGVFLVVFGLGFCLSRWRKKRYTLTSDTYARVDDIRSQGAIEMSPTSSSSSSFVLGDEEKDSLSHLELEANPELSPQQFESMWLAFQARENLQFTLTFGDSNVEDILSAQSIKCMASGAQGPRQKYYFFARERVTGSVILLEVFVLPRDREMACEIRCANSALLPDMVSYVKHVMKPFSRASGMR